MKTQLQFPVTDRKSDEIIAFQAGTAVTVSQFLQQAHELSLRLPDHRYVFNLFTDRFNYLLGFCASLMAGQCTLMPPNRLAETLDQLARQYPDSYFLDENNLPGKNVKGDRDPGKLTEQAASKIPLIPVDQLCAIAFTSGSTGDPKPNLKYWETLRTSSFGNAKLLLIQDSEQLNIVATVPPQHMWGLETSILFPLFCNVAISDRTPFYPADIAEALGSLPPPRALVSSPVHLGALLKSGVSLVQLDRIYSATAPMSQEFARQLETQFDTDVFEVFGTSESGTLAGRHTARETLWHLSGLFDLEVKTDGVLIKAQHLPGDVLMQDIIEKVGNDRFKWIGRHHDMVNIAGKRGSLADLNRRLLAIEGVLDGVIFQPENGSERLAAMVVAPQMEPSDILGQLKQVVEPVFLPRPIHLVASLPRQETGKLANTAIMNLYKKIELAKKSTQQQ